MSTSIKGSIEGPSATERSVVGWQFDNTYARLPDALFTPAQPASFAAPQVAILNHGLAKELGLDLAAMLPSSAAALFAGQELPHGCQPIAQAYAGHQFGSFTMLGDGRASLLGEHRTPSGQLVDIQLKGAGRTLYSRGGDGLAALGPMLREYIISEAMAGLGIPTTRSLAVVTTGEPVYRSKQLPGAVLTRVAASHIRVGTFQYLAARRDTVNLRLLADYAISRHFPELADRAQKYVEFFRSVVDRQAALIAKWQLVGFIHGVMNTDNMAISGETIDYGPCAFMNAYRQSTVFSSIDHGGRYAYGNQPAIAQWNLTRLAETLLPLFDSEQEKAVAIATEVLNEFPERFGGHWIGGMRKKLGLQTAEDGDDELIRTLLEWMESSKVDFTNTFRDFSTGRPLKAGQYQDPRFRAWRSQWCDRLRREGRPDAIVRAEMQSANPAVIPRNHRVEEALTAAEEQGDLTVLQRLLAALARPFEEKADSVYYREPPQNDRCYKTFCGT
jgi:uncharacterized protein YdiU (UPF0061 family)